MTTTGRCTDPFIEPYLRLLLALNGHLNVLSRCPLSGVERTSI